MAGLSAPLLGKLLLGPRMSLYVPQGHSNPLPALTRGAFAGIRAPHRPDEGPRDDDAGGAPVGELALLPERRGQHQFARSGTQLPRDGHGEHEQG